MLRNRLLPLLVLAALVSGAGAQEAPPEDQLEAIEDEIETRRERQQALEQEAADIAQEIQDISEQLVDHAAAVRAHEANLAGIRDDIAALREEEKATDESLEATARSMVASLAALQRLSQRPPELLLVRPGEITTSVRTALLLSHAVPALREEAAHLRSELERLGAIRGQLTAARREEAAELSAAREQHQEMQQLFGRRDRLRTRLVAQAGLEEQEIRRLAEEAESIRDLLESLERQRAAAAPVPAPPSIEGRTFADARGALPLPALGTVSARYGDPQPAGSLQGIQVTTQPGAQIIAPFDGRIVYAGTFRDYGQLLIIKHGEAYHTLLAGLDRIDTGVGQWVLTGEPLGRMIADRADELYIELRVNNEPVNPMDWFRDNTGRTGG